MYKNFSNCNFLMNLIIFSSLLSIVICFKFGKSVDGEWYNNFPNKNQTKNSYLSKPTKTAKTTSKHKTINDNNYWYENNNYYCAQELCPGGKKHVACNNDGSFGPSCPPNAKMIDISRYQNLFVDLHNKYRSQVAMGQLPGYEPAVRMATMKWDNELAKLAELNVKKCKFDHDECYNTKKFRNAGQCLAGVWYSPEQGYDIQDKIRESVRLWFEEYSIIDMSYVHTFKMEWNFEDYGHFLEVVLDRNTHVGCAAIEFTSYNQPNFMRINIACNYGSIFSYEDPVYKAGPTASKCKTGINHKYPGLCSEKERINPNIYVYGQLNF